MGKKEVKTCYQGFVRLAYILRGSTTLPANAAYFINTTYLFRTDLIFILSGRHIDILEYLTIPLELDPISPITTELYGSEI